MIIYKINGNLFQICIIQNVHLDVHHLMTSNKNYLRYILTFGGYDG